MPALFLWEAAHLVAAEPSWLLHRNVTVDGQNRAEYGSDCKEDVPLWYLCFDGGIHDNRQFLAAIKTSCRVIFSGCSLEPFMRSTDCFLVSTATQQVCSLDCKQINGDFLCAINLFCMFYFYSCDLETF